MSKPTYEELEKRVKELENAGSTGLKDDVNVIESRLFLKTVTDNLKDAVFAKDIKRRFTFVNPAAAGMLGLPENKILGKTAEELLSSEDASIIRDIDNINLKGKPVSEVRHLLAAGDERFLHTIQTPVFDNNGNIIGISGVVRDITERKKVEEKLVRSIETVKVAEKNANIGSWQWDIKTNMIEWSENLCRIHGIEPEDFDGTDENARKFLHPDDLEHINYNTQYILSNKKSKEFQYRIITPDNIEKHVHATNQLKFDEYGEVVEMSGMLQDITEHKKAEIQKEELLHNIGERVKELDCMYNVSKLVEKPGILLEGLFQGVVNFIPPGWHYPEITCARIKYDGKDFKTDNFKLTKWRQSANINVSGENVGIIELCYLKKMPELDEGPFMKEERNLINSLAERLGRVIERIKGEEYLRQFEHIVSSSSDMLALLSRQYKYITANESYFETFNLLPGQLIGKTVSDVFGEGFFKTVIKPNADRCLAGEEVNYQAWFEFPAVGKKYMEITYYPYLSIDKTISGFVVNGRDITKRKKAEEALRKNEEKFRTVTRTAEIGITETNLITGKVIWDDTCYRIHGFESGTEINLDRFLKDIVHPDEKKNALIRYKELLNSDKTHFRIEYKILRPDNTVRWLDEDHTIIRDPEGKAISTFSAKIDITERKLAENELLKTRDMLERTGRMAKVGGWEKNLKTGEDNWSEITKEIHEVGPDFVPTMQNGIEFYKEGESREIIIEAVSHTIKTGEPFDVELQIITAKGKERWIRAIGDTEFEGIEAVRLFGTFQDITERKQLEEQLQIRQRMDSLGTLAGGIAHDFNNILTGILGNLSVLEYDSLNFT